MKELRFGEMMFIVEMQQSLSNDCLVKKEFHFVMPISRDQHGRPSQPMKAVRFNNLMCICEANQPLFNDFLIKQ
jgi:hypothetical protein